MKEKRKLFGLAVSILAMAAVAAAQGEPDRWLHVRVTESDKAETVRVNLPLRLAEAILPAIKLDRLQNGKVRVSEVKVENVDVRALMEAVRSAQDGEFVSVQGEEQEVRVAKKAGYLLVQVQEDKAAGKTKTVDVKLPLSVVEALLSGGKDELDVLAAVRALARHGDADLVTVKDGKSTVRIWVDSKNTSE